MGGSTTISTSEQRIGSIKIQQSSYGLTLPKGYGRYRTNGNLMWYGDFTAIATTTTTSSGGKGGSVKQKDTKYTYTASLAMAVSEALSASMQSVWRGKERINGVQMPATTQSAVELLSVPSTGKVKLSMYAYYTSLTSVHLAQGLGEQADTLLTNGTHYTVSAGVVQVNVATYPQYKGRSLRIAYLWTPPTGMLSATSGSGLSFFGGSIGQAPWSYLTSKHPTEALSYSGVCYVAAADYDLTNTAEIPQHNFEINGPFQYPGKWDAEPSDIVTDILTNPESGSSFPADNLGDMTNFSTYCKAMNIFLSPVYGEQREARECITDIMVMTNCAPVWSEGVLKIIPYGDETITANGATYVPNLTPLYDLSDDDYIVSGAEDPVQCDRKTPADAFNVVQVEFLNRANGYNIDIVEAKDQANIEEHGLRPMQPVKLHGICDPEVAKVAAQLILQRNLYIRNEYSAKLGWKYCLLEPMDFVTLTDSGLGLSKTPVRIIEVEEREDGDLAVRFEDFPFGVSAAALYPNQNSEGYYNEWNAPPGPVTAPVFFEAPIEKTQTGLEVYAAVSGADPEWGGCYIWASFDGDSYRRVGIINGGARYGTLRSTFNTSAGSLAAVELLGQGGQLLAGSAADAANLSTLCWCDDEYFTYTGSALVAANQYDLTSYTRGAYKSKVVSHATGKSFVRVDDAIGKSGPLDLSMIGNTLYFKFTSFNIYGGGEEALEDVVAYPYQVRGNMVALPPSTVPAVSYVLEGFGIRLNWTTVPDQDVSEYEIRIGGASWDDATFLATVKGSSYLWAIQTAGSRIVRVRAKDFFGNYSLADATVTTVVAAPAAVAPVAQFVDTEIVLTWGSVTGSFNIDRYEIRTGASWAAGTVVDISYTTTFKEAVAWVGARTYWIAAVDVAGNVGSPVSVSPTVTGPATVSITNEVIDNNVLLRWTDAKQTLPINKYELRKGATWATASVIGVAGDNRFATFFEQVGGTYTYWVQATDSAGNVSTPASASAQVSQPPDYVLRSDIYSTFSGTLSNAVLQDGKLYAPLNSAETWQTHFTSRSWATPQAQVDAGYPKYFQPSADTSYYEEEFDYGAELPATGIAATLSYQTLSGSVTVTPKISVKKLSGDAWTDYAGQAQVVATGFRYVKVRFDFTAAGGDDLIEITSLNVRLSSKLRNDGGDGTAAAGDTGGTTVNFNIPFIDVQSITVTAKGTTATIAIYDFTDVPNPTSFKVLLYNTSGTRVSGGFSWSAKGI